MKANQQPIDCDKWDQGSCGNACCVLDVHVDGAVDDAYDALAAYLEGGGGDGLYAKAPTSDTVGHVSEDDQGDYPFQFSPALPWRYTTRGVSRDERRLRRPAEVQRRRDERRQC